MSNSTKSASEQKEVICQEESQENLSTHSLSSNAKEKQEHLDAKNQDEDSTCPSKHEISQPQKEKTQIDMPLFTDDTQLPNHQVEDLNTTLTDIPTLGLENGEKTLIDIPVVSQEDIEQQSKNSHNEYEETPTQNDLNEARHKEKNS